VLVVGDVARAQLRRFGRTVVDPGSGVEPVLIVRVHEMLYALDARCPHLGRSLVDARSRGTRLQCRGHDWTVDLDTGACLPPKGSAPPLQARRYEVWAEGSLVLLRIPSPNSRHTTW
jgi:nitrite reductase/ring-hydroxylating ferredoxin subunit